MTKLALQLFGAFNLSADGAAITRFHSDKARALLAYIAVEHTQLHNRTTLAALFWPQSSSRSALTNVRNVLANLRKLAPELLTITRSTVRWSEAADVDVQQFRTKIADHPADALPLYRGDFLDGLTLPDAPEFDEWRLIQQEQLHQQMMDGLERLAATALAEHAYEQAMACANRQLTAVAWHEPAHRSFMQALAAQGKRTAALQQFERCRQILADELGIEPSAATLALVEEISAEKSTRHNLPPLAESLIGRTNLQAQLTELVLSQRMVTVTGVGGVGKSSLALAVAHGLLDRQPPPFPDGIWFVPLVAIGDVGAIEPQVVAALSNTLNLRVETVDGLVNALQGKRLLLLLDNFEQLVVAAENLLHALYQKTDVHLLITSRIRTQLRGERHFPLHGLSMAAAVSLFLARARQVNAGFEGERTAIRPIIEQVEGLPLAIELAASWVEHFTLQELRDAINTNLTASANVDLPDRHSNLRAIFEQSWQWLSENERRTLVQLSVFRGSLRREAVLAVTDATLNHLSALRSKSLVRLESAGVYSLHEVIREFSAEKGATLNLLAPAQHAHATHFLTRLRDNGGVAMREEAANVRAAWRHAHQPNYFDLMAACVGPYSDLIETTGLISELMVEKQLSLDAILPMQESAERDRLIAKLYYALSQAVSPALHIDHLNKALRYAKESELRSYIHCELGGNYAELNQHDEATKHFERMADLARESGEPSIIANSLSEVAQYRTLHFRGDYDIAIAQMQEVIAIHKDEPTDTIAYHDRQQKLAFAYIRYGSYDRAMAILDALIAQEDATTPYQAADALLQYGLAATFAGLHTAANTHNERCLALVREIDDTEGVGLLHANLTLSQRRAGNPAKAAQHGRLAVRQLAELNWLRKLGQAQTRLGHALLALADWQGACEAYRAALALWESTNHPNQFEAHAGLAHASLQLGDQTTAIEQVEKVCQATDLPMMERVVEPALMIWNACEVLRAVGNSAELTRLQTVGEQWVALIAGRIESADVRRAFLKVTANWLPVAANQAG